uniref:Platelet glycoprotein V-like n=1 Tax=Saccoglossus kowalevskii TaxID=10224 RepID=A0ABM0M8P5_SACKO|nr:PREDICTED: platelet glycoprotein V-like [Saccoglossus kowalevskii]
MVFISLIIIVIFTLHEVTPERNNRDRETFNECPENCTCMAYEMNCVNFTSIPPSLPIYTKKLVFQTPRFSLPIQVFQDYTKLEYLMIIDGHIQTISTRAFANAPLLLHLHLENNIIRIMRQDAFDGLGNLLILKLLNNNINKITANLFGEMNSLSWLEIESASLKLNLESGSFQGLDNLWMLSLGNNNLGSLENPEYLGGMPLLEQLKLHSNKLTYIVDAAFTYVRNLKFLDLSYNSLDNLRPEIFQPKLPLLETLKLRYNPLNSVPSTIFKLLPSLKNLDLQFTGIHQIDATAFQSAPNLLSLSLNDNYGIEAVPSSALGVLRHLKVLHLCGNHITTIKSQAFVTMTNLTHMRITNTDLKNIEIDAFLGLSKLQLLELSNNQLNRLPEEVFVPLSITKETAILLSHNPWSCDCVLKGFVERYHDEYNDTATLKGMFGDMECKSPPNLTGQSVWDISTDNMTCSDDAILPSAANTETSHSLKITIVICSIIGCVIILGVVFMILVYSYRRCSKKHEHDGLSVSDNLRIPMRLWDDSEVL